MLYLIINTGSTSTKIAVYKDDFEIFNKNIRHPEQIIQKFINIWDQYDYRKCEIIKYLEENGFTPGKFDIVVSRGGVAKPIPSGIYYINNEMLEDMKSGKYGDHACNVGCRIAYDLSKENKIPCITVDPPSTDEMSVLAKYSGIPLFVRKSSFHALNQKATARKYAKEIKKKYEEINLIVVHLGGGISVGAHQNGKVLDVNNALDGDGPFAPERSGSLPVGDLINLCFSGKYSKEEILKLVNGKGGLMSYLGTKNVLKIEKMIREGDKKTKEVFEALGYQVAKEIGAAAVVLNGRIDAIVITGNIAKSTILIEFIKNKISFLAPIKIDPGENEIEALAQGAIRYTKKEEKAKLYN